MDVLRGLIDCSYSKPYCFADLKCYLHLVSAEQIRELVHHIEAIQAKKFADSDKLQVILFGIFSKSFIKLA